MRVVAGGALHPRPARLQAAWTQRRVVQGSDASCLVYFSLQMSAEGVPPRAFACEKQPIRQHSNALSMNPENVLIH